MFDHFRVYNLNKLESNIKIIIPFSHHPTNKLLFPVKSNASTENLFNIFLNLYNALLNSFTPTSSFYNKLSKFMRYCIIVI